MSRTDLAWLARLFSLGLLGSGCSSYDGVPAIADASGQTLEISPGQEMERHLRAFGKVGSPCPFFCNDAPWPALNVRLHGPVTWQTPPAGPDPLVARVTLAARASAQPDRPKVAIDPPLPLDVVLEPDEESADFDLASRLPCDDSPSSCEQILSLRIDGGLGEPNTIARVELQASASYDTDDPDDVAVEFWP